MREPSKTAHPYLSRTKRQFTRNRLLPFDCHRVYARIQELVGIILCRLMSGERQGEIAVSGQVKLHLGFRGGLKGCERQLDIDRGDLKNIDGFFAVLLWDEYQRTGGQKVLDTLLAYNIQDTINLENLMVTAYNLKLRDTPFYESHCIRESTPPPNPFRVDLTTVDRIKNSSQYWSSLQW